MTEQVPGERLPDVAARNAKYRQALKDVVNPLEMLRREAEAGGAQLGHMAYSVANNLSFVQDIAKTALESDTDTEDLNEKVRRLQILLSRYGDRVRMANAPEWQDEIDEAMVVGSRTHNNPHLRDHLSTSVDLQPLSFERVTIPFERFKEWFDLRAEGKWSWTKNHLCKYITIGIDTRSGIYSIRDRDDENVTFDRLMWQYSDDTPTPPS